MADNAGTQEDVALRLLYLVAHAESKELTGLGARTDRKWILDAYAECLKATKNFRDIKAG